jgi:Domain of unknown function (DUF4157)
MQEEEEEVLQAEDVSGQTREVPSHIEYRMRSLRGGGQPLSESVRNFFEPHFGHDFSGVRVHTDREADMHNRALSALAFTTGQDIFFRQGTYDPFTPSGQELLAHELTHVVQQAGGAHASVTIGSPNDPPEREADEIAAAVVRARPHTVGRRSGAVLQFALENRRQVRAEVTNVTTITDVPVPVVNELFARVRLRRRILALKKQSLELARRHIVTFPNGDWGFFGITQSEYTDKQSRLLNRIDNVREQIWQKHLQPVSLANVNLVVADPLGQNPGTEDTIRIGETVHTLTEEEGTKFRVETRWEKVKEFPPSTGARPAQGLVYLFVIVTKPADIASGASASAITARDAVITNKSIFDHAIDRAAVVQVDSIESFIKLWGLLNSAAQRDKRLVWQVEVFSHGGLDGPIFGDDRKQFGLKGAPALSTLPRLPYTGDAMVFFRGCRVGAGRFLEKFGGLQGVASYGFEGATNFSRRLECFYVWKEGTPAY